jgi:hypothetical protein
VLADLRNVQALNHKMSDQVSAMIPVVQKIEQKVHALTTTPFLAKTDDLRSDDPRRTPSPFDVLQALNEVVVDDSNQKQAQEETKSSTPKTSGKHFYSGFLPFQKRK